MSEKCKRCNGEGEYVIPGENCSEFCKPCQGVGYIEKSDTEIIKKLKEQNAILVEQNKQFNAERIYAQNHAALADKPVDKRADVICNELKNLIGIPALSSEQKVKYLDTISETIGTLRLKLQDENN